MPATAAGGGGAAGPSSPFFCGVPFYARACALLSSTPPVFLSVSLSPCPALRSIVGLIPIPYPRPRVGRVSVFRFRLFPCPCSLFCPPDGSMAVYTASVHASPMAAPLSHLRSSVPRSSAVPAPMPTVRAPPWPDCWVSKFRAHFRTGWAHRRKILRRIHEFGAHNSAKPKCLNGTRKKRLASCKKKQVLASRSKREGEGQYDG